jgi:hypothetical protein
MLVVVAPKLTDEETEKYLGKHINKYSTIISTDADVYSTDGTLLLKFRKNVIPKSLLETAVEGLGKFLLLSTTDRGTAGASEKGLSTGKKYSVKSNIIGYFDKYTISQKGKHKREGIKPSEPCRLCRWNRDNPEVYETKVVPLIEHIDTLYKKLCPKEHKKQYEEAKKTKYRISDTSFSTVTINHNFRTAGHYDNGDYEEGFGNLVVYEKGNYNGGFIGFPKYDIGVDIRTGDFLAMDVHQLHANTAIESPGEYERISFVSYLRKGIAKKCNTIV